MAGNPVEVTNKVTVRTESQSTQVWQPAGIVAAVAYADGDAIGGMTEVDAPLSGVLQSALYIDRDDEGLAVDLVVCLLPFDTPILDNATMALSDDDLLKVIHVIAFATFSDFTNGQISSVTAIGKRFGTDPSRPRKLYVQARARGALNIASGSEPRFVIDYLVDER